MDYDSNIRFPPTQLSMRIFQIFKSFDAEVVAAALFSGVLAAWLFGSSIYAWFTDAHSLQDRSLFFQFGFYSLTAVALSIVFLVFASRQVKWMTIHPEIAFGLAAIVPLAAYAVMGTFTRFVADDFSSAYLTSSYGIFGATWDWYINWSGRFTASFFDSVAGALPPSSMSATVGIAILLWLMALTGIFSRLFPQQRSIRSIFLSILLSAVLLTCTFQVTPDIGQSLYWGQGMRSVILPLVSASFIGLLIILFFIEHGNRITLKSLLIGFLCFLTGGFGETYVTLQTTSFVLLIVLVLIDRGGKWHPDWQPILLAGLVGSLTAMGVMIAAPGNLVRQSYFPPPPGLIRLVSIALDAYGRFLSNLLMNLNHILNLLATLLTGFVIGWFSSHPVGDWKDVTIPRIRKAFLSSFPKTVFFLIAVFFMLTFACFLPSAYGMSSAPQERTLIIPVFLVSLFMAALGISAGRFIHRYSTRISIFQSQNPRVWRIAGWVIFLGFLTHISFITRQILVPLPDYRLFAQKFDQADDLIRQAAHEGLPSVEVPEVHNHFGLSDYGAGTTLWLDDAVEGYYGIKVIVNKNMK
jgi:hypothetical protein